MSDEMDLTKEEPNVPTPTEPKPAVQLFDMDEYRARAAARAVYLLFGLLYLIAGATFVMLWRIDDLKIQDIELSIFALLALVGIVAGPLLAYFFKSSS